ncbi:MAG: gamma-glutamylcyclotransferase [Hyphomicrobiaceae bacterium]
MVEPTGRELWIFGYGSLMWRPDFPYVERRQVVVTGYHRAFCIASTVHRGTQARPGLVLGLDRGGACEGVAYRVAPENQPNVMTYLRERELIYGVYQETQARARIVNGPVHQSVTVLAYTAERCHPSYAGGLSLAMQSRIIRGAKGQSGANLDYLINTVRHLQKLGIREPALERLMTVTAGHAAHLEPDAQHRATVAGLHRIWAMKPTENLTVPRGDQRRFGHRVRVTRM